MEIDDLNIHEYGMQRWEHYFVDGYTHYFKRPKLEVPEIKAENKNATKSKR